jgi:hypothetical protein
MIRLSIDRIGSLSKIADNDSHFACCVIILLAAVVITGCHTPPATSPAPLQMQRVVGAGNAPPQAVFENAVSAIPALIKAERVGSIQGDTDSLTQLWTEDARIIDGRTTAGRDDDYTWTGRDAILDRYVVAVFPNPPPPLAEPLQIDIVVDENRDEAYVAIGVDEWHFVRRSGRWWIAELAYQRPQ